MKMTVFYIWFNSPYFLSSNAVQVVVIFSSLFLNIYKVFINIYKCFILLKN